MPTARFRLGKIDGEIPDERGSLSEIREDLGHNDFPESLVVENEDYELRRGSRSPYHENGEEEDMGEEIEDFEEFIYFRYVSEVVETAIALDENGEDKENDNVNRDTMEFILLNDGRFIYESASDVSPGQAFEVLFGEQFDQLGIDYVDDLSISNDVMRSFYDNNDQIREVIITGIDAEPDDEEPMRSIIEMGEVGDSVAFNAGEDSDADLDNASLVGDFVDVGDIKLVSATNPGQNQKTISENNWVKFYYSKNLDEGARSRLIYNRVKPILDKVTGEEK